MMRPDPQIEIVEQTLRTDRMISASDAVLIAVSGGPDSTALLHILQTLAPALSIRLGVAHLNHQLRGAASERDAQFVESLAKKLDLPYYGQNKDVREYRRCKKCSLEEAGRLLRYSFFDSIAVQYGYDKIATAHHADDNAELVLMHLIRGSGPTGLSGIPRVREGKIIRPLIRLTRSQIMDYLGKNRLDYVIDASNQDFKYLRNRIRHQLLPILSRDFNPCVRGSLNQFAGILRDEEDYMERIVDGWFQQGTDPTVKEGTALRISSLDSLHPALIRRILRRAVKITKGDLRRISFAHIGSAMNLLPRSAVGKHLDLPEGIGIERRRDHLLIIEGKPEIGDFEYRVEFDAIRGRSRLTITETGDVLQFSVVEPAAVPPLKGDDPDTVFFDLDEIDFPLWVRNSRPGDRFIPFGMGGSQKVKKYFIDHKIERSARRRCPLLLSDSGDILWIAGHRRSRTAPLHPKCPMALKVELLLA